MVRPINGQQVRSKSTGRIRLTRFRWGWASSDRSKPTGPVLEDFQGRQNKPTHTRRCVAARGDGDGLGVVETFGMYPRWRWREIGDVDVTFRSGFDYTEMVSLPRVAVRRDDDGGNRKKVGVGSMVATEVVGNRGAHHRRSEKACRRATRVVLVGEKRKWFEILVFKHRGMGRMILETFGVEKYTDEFINSTNYLLKVMKYEGSQTNEPSLRALSDQTTILYQNEADGLEILSKDGEWITVKPSPSSFIFIVGESLSVWLNGGLSSPYHRVVMKGNKVRYSIGLFVIARDGYQVKVPEELVDDKNSLLFKPFDYEEFLGLYSAKVAGGALLGYGLKSYLQCLKLHHNNSCIKY
ncbi:katanin p60 ATPase-containing subunit A1-like [Hibiscus syriacus]|uniref:Katanin p60 ATPase-containing subunit A1-like n=1 Tax=Hibiscus syriacus TaxID=106335 RepID=A0A6A3ARV2_HIBSY|nr:katanin p60 ATPase-containing subunit A1-like [Hibiscus syriacus]